MVCQFLEYIIRAVAGTVAAEDVCRLCLTSWTIAIGFNTCDDISQVLEECFFRNTRGLCNSNAEVYPAANSHVKYLGY
jgi:hypothetical protein